MIEIDTGEDQQGGFDAGDGAPPQSSPPEKLRRQHRENEAAPVERPVGPRHPGPQSGAKPFLAQPGGEPAGGMEVGEYRSEEHTSELQSLMRISYAVFCLKKKNSETTNNILLQQTNSLR